MTADEAATWLEEMLACQQGPIVHHCHDHHRAVELGEHIDAVLLELDRLRHHAKSIEAELRWTRALVRRLCESLGVARAQQRRRDGVEEPDAGPVRSAGITATTNVADGLLTGSSFASRTAADSPQTPGCTLAICAGCGDAFSPSRQPTAGRKSWCAACKTWGRDAVDRKRRQRDRSGVK